LARGVVFFCELRVGAEVADIQHQDARELLRMTVQIGKRTSWLSVRPIFVKLILAKDVKKIERDMILKLRAITSETAPRQDEQPLLRESDTLN
jgi:hypothetical protein